MRLIAKTKMSKTTGSTNTMEISFGVLGEVKVDDNIDCLNINTTSEEIRAHQIAANTSSEVVEDRFRFC